MIPVSFSSIGFLSIICRERKQFSDEYFELKLTGTARNRSKTHIGERTTDKGV